MAKEAAPPIAGHCGPRRRRTAVAAAAAAAAHDYELARAPAAHARRSPLPHLCRSSFVGTE